MKKISTLLFGLLIMNSCSQEQPKNFLTLSGKLENSKDSILTIANQQGVIKEINVNTTGIFKDTLKVPKGTRYRTRTTVSGNAPKFTTRSRARNLKFQDQGHVFSRKRSNSRSGESQR